MKRILAILTLFLAIGNNIQAQQDTAARIIDRYLNLLNYEHIYSDSILYIETVITDNRNAKDTILLRRWFMPPSDFRTEVWNKGRLETAFYNYGDSLRQSYDKIYNDWRYPSAETYYNMQRMYDFRSPIYFWRTNGAEIAFEGEKTLNGHPVYQVLVRIPGLYDRHYIFEKESGLLTLYTEDTTHLVTSRHHDNNRVDWRAIHEYLPVGPCLIPTIESYQIYGHIFILRSTVKLLARNPDIFKRKRL